MDPAKPTGKPPQEVTLTGMLMPAYSNDQPVLVCLEGDEGDYFLPVFSSKETFDHGMQPIRYDKIKKIDEGHEFLSSIPTRLDTHRVRVVVDLRRTPEGKTRFLEIFRD